MWFWYFIVSAVFNVLLVLYARWLIKTISVINEDISSLSGLINDFSKHLHSVHELEMFYGDETLKSLMDHARSLSEKIFDLDLVLNEEEPELGTEED